MLKSANPLVAAVIGAVVCLIVGVSLSLIFSRGQLSGRVQIVPAIVVPLFVGAVIYLVARR